MLRARVDVSMAVLASLSCSQRPPRRSRAGCGSRPRIEHRSSRPAAAAACETVSNAVRPRPTSPADEDTRPLGTTATTRELAPNGRCQVPTLHPSPAKPPTTAAKGDCPRVTITAVISEGPLVEASLAVSPQSCMRFSLSCHSAAQGTNTTGTGPAILKPPHPQSSRPKARRSRYLQSSRA